MELKRARHAANSISVFTIFFLYFNDGQSDCPLTTQRIEGRWYAVNPMRAPIARDGTIRARMLREKFWLRPSRAKINCKHFRLEQSRAKIYKFEPKRAICIFIKFVFFNLKFKSKRNSGEKHEKSKFFQEFSKARLGSPSQRAIGF